MSGLIFRRALRRPLILAEMCFISCQHVSLIGDGRRFCFLGRPAYSARQLLWVIIVFIISYGEFTERFVECERKLCRMLYKLKVTEFGSKQVGN